jgi:hypothetical protein
MVYFRADVEIPGVSECTERSDIVFYRILGVHEYRSEAR